ncbi:TetR/AcrR family transcriptional regulator [Anaeroselena agilis]|uniref:TetR/AcrR family transcriptional regulator n=1 Tax=Anaeroselena agilis TaxID=3063788 RepID=A0ABU3NTP1_9FIRM|nr:TetR/AcrR family transcriptional regulator [Selenomonadales bacterium 4137-cl]
MAYYREDPQGDDSRSKRQQILEAAYAVFSRKGYHRATVDEIIALADTGKGTVYNYFNNKEQLFYTLIRERSQPFETALEQVADADQPVLDKLQAMVRLFLRFYLDNAALWRVMMHEIRGFGSDGLSYVKAETRDKYREGFSRTIGMLGRVLQEGIDQGLLREVNVAHTAHALFSVIVALTFQQFVADVDTAAHEVTDIFLYGLVRK